MPNKVVVSISALALPLLLVAGGYAVSHRAPKIRGVEADTIPLAAAARRQCEAVEAAQRQPCYERFLVDLIGTRGVRVAMGTLNALAQQDASIKGEGHVYAHAIGIQAGRGRRDVAAQFASCTEILQSGCYHGVIQSYFEGMAAVDTGNVNALCRPFADGRQQWLNFQCAHGMGHGLMMVYRNDLPLALQGCDLVSDSWIRESCYGGAFMENIVSATVPHHPANRLGAAGDSAKAGGHDHGGGHDHAGAAPAPAALANRPPWKALDSLDMHYPCNAVGQRYQTQCYMMQTSIVMRFTNGNVDSSAAMCLTAPGAMKYVCAQSLGRDIVSWTRENLAESRDRCAVVADEYEPWCHVGVAKNLIDVTSHPADGIAYCRQISGDANRLKCFEAVGEQIGNLFADTERRRQACAPTEAYAPACEFGAQVNFRRPQGLPRERT